MNQLYYGDTSKSCASTSRTMSVDLIYLRGGGREKRWLVGGRADPPFNSKRDYNLLFKSPKSVAAVYDRRKLSEQDDDAHRAPLQPYSAAQIEAFEDSWHWGEQAERVFDELVHAPNTDVAKMMKALLEFLGRNDRGGGRDSRRLVGGRATAYLVMMANRLLQFHRVLKPI